MITKVVKTANGNVEFYSGANLVYIVPPLCRISVVKKYVHVQWADERWTNLEAGKLLEMQILPAAAVDVSGWDAQQIAKELSDNFFFDVGSFISFGNLVFITQKSDFPTPIAGVISLPADTAYFIAGDIDLQGDRIETSGHVAIIGSSSETSYLTSTGLTAGVPLITSLHTIAIKNVTIRDVDTGFYIDDNGGANAPLAIDWLGVNFENVPNVGEVGTIDNFIFQVGALLNSKNLIFTGTVGTIGIESSLFSGDGLAGDLIKIADTAVITRRLRVIYTSFVAFGATNGINVDALATIPTESYILDTVNFSGGGTYLVGVGASSNLTLFVNCKGIENTAVNGQLYMQGNVTATTISNTTGFFKIAGTTTPSPENSKFLHSNNRLTCDAVIERKFLVQAVLSFTSAANNVLEFGFFDSNLGAIRTPSRTKSTANAGGRAENIALFCVVKMNQGDYLEVHVRNTTGANNATIDQLNFLVTEIQ
jgi:hypothetical protein